MLAQPTSECLTGALVLEPNETLDIEVMSCAGKDKRAFCISNVITRDLFSEYTAESLIWPIIALLSSESTFSYQDKNQLHDERRD